MTVKRPPLLAAAILVGVTLWPGGTSGAASVPGAVTGPIPGSAETVATASVQGVVSPGRRCWRRGPLNCCASSEGVRCHRRDRLRDLDDLHDRWLDRHRRHD
ncbi:hypothetical protein [Streptosporangium carneum]|uniref:Secreted protein n=1 Tax=Streptosporangium carneum TaxID=47481 RepID=A0A9W6MHV4_9ACTN|nr:hypothetical protein [Streptosporangium carneum]GLK15264.1 hypothetical protein GCM10017600_86770 [Streptosporangium carneum]